MTPRRSRASPPRAQPGPRSPTAVNAFVGRIEHLDAIARTFAQGARLVTITGPVGIGKSRLATEFLTTRAASTTDPPAKYRADLTEARDADDVCITVGAALGAPLAHGKRAARLIDQLGKVLASGCDPWLVLDQADFVADALGDAVSRWLLAAPTARFLVTSRERLRIASEFVHELPPIGVPAGVTELRGSESFQLLVARIRQARAGYVPDPDDGVALCRVLERLEGNPLAIELAARRLAIVAPAEFLARLNRHANASGPTVEPESGLRDLVAESWHRLDADEQATLSRCAVFRGGFSLEAAECVAASPDADGTLDVLQRLHEKSLVRVDVSNDPGSPPRFGMYLSIRSFAEECLANRGESALAMSRHAAYTVAFGERRAATLQGPKAPEGSRGLALERDNLIAVAQRALDARTSASVPRELGVRALLSLEALVAEGSPVESYALLVERMLDTDGAAFPTALRASLLGARANLERVFGNADGSRARYEQAIGLARDAGATALEGRLRRGYAFALMILGQIDRARAECEHALELYREAGDAPYTAVILAGLAMMSQKQGRAADALVYYARALEITRVSRDQRLEGALRLNQAMLLLAIGELPAAREQLEAARELERRVDRRRLRGSIESTFGQLAHLEGRSDDALAHYRAARAMLAAVGFVQFEGLACGFEGLLQLERGDLAEARARFTEAIALLRDAGDRHNEAEFVALRASCDAELGRIDDARRGLREARAVPGVMDSLELAGLIELQEAHVELALARAAKGTGALEEAQSHTDRARAIIARATEPHAPDAGHHEAPRAPVAATNFDVRMSLRALAARAVDTLVRTEAAEAARTTLRAPTETTGRLIVHARGQWFQPPGGARVDCSHRAQVRAILAALVSQRVTAPGVPLSADRLVAAAWPGERILPSAARSRLHVAISTLRKLGLGEILAHRGEGYLLRAEVPIRRVDETG